MPLKKNEQYEMTIDGMTSEGNGVGRIDQFAVFVPQTAIGDLCEVKIVKLQKSYAYGRLTRLIHPSKERVPVDCAAFPQCGGCSCRHISYNQELYVKEDLVRNAFARIGGISAAVHPIIASTTQSGYRNKAQYPLGKNESGNIIAGFYAKRSHRIVPQTFCDLQPAFFEDIKEEILRFLNSYSISVYDEKTHSGLMRHIYIRHGEVTGEVMVCLVATKKHIPELNRLIETLTERFQEIKSIVINVNPKDTNAILGKTCITVFGSGYINDEICGIRVKLSPLSFYQVNRSQAEVLYRNALDFAGLKHTDTLIDFYCGTGTIGLIAANRIRSLVGVELIPQAVADARDNARENRIGNSRFLCADAGEAAAVLLNEGVQPDVVIVDAPRKGLDIAVIEAIGNMKPERLVMVSCNPATAARDCKLLLERGYQTEEIQPVDMFPRTHHVETIVKLLQTQNAM